MEFYKKKTLFLLLSFLGILFFISNLQENQVFSSINAPIFSEPISPSIKKILQHQLNLQFSSYFIEKAYKKFVESQKNIVDTSIQLYQNNKNDFIYLDSLGIKPRWVLRPFFTDITRFFFEGICVESNPETQSGFDISLQIFPYNLMYFNFAEILEVTPIKEEKTGEDKFLLIYPKSIFSNDSKTSTTNNPKSQDEFLERFHTSQRCIHLVLDSKEGLYISLYSEIIRERQDFLVPENKLDSIIEKLFLFIPNIDILDESKFETSQSKTFIKKLKKFNKANSSMELKEYKLQEEKSEIKGKKKEELQESQKPYRIEEEVSQQHEKELLIEKKPQEQSINQANKYQIPEEKAVENKCQPQKSLESVEQYIMTEAEILRKQEEELDSQNRLGEETSKKLQEQCYRKDEIEEKVLTEPKELQENNIKTFDQSIVNLKLAGGEQILNNYSDKNKEEKSDNPYLLIFPSILIISGLFLSYRHQKNKKHKKQEHQNNNITKKKKKYFFYR